jgi:hypothetical protein
LERNFTQRTAATPRLWECFWRHPVQKSDNLVTRQITTFRSTTGRIYDGGPKIL